MCHLLMFLLAFLFNDTATTEIYTYRTHSFPTRRSSDLVVTGTTRHQLGFQHLVAVEHVISHLDAGLGLEVGDGVLGNVIGPVVNVQDLVLGCRRSGRLRRLRR